MARAVRFLKDSQVEFSKLFSELCRMKSSWEAWTDFVVMSATTIANAFDREGPTHDEREQKYISYSLLCKWFRVAVLPADRLLYAELYQTGDKKKCTECGAFFASTSNSVKYCPVCRKRITRRQAAERMRKRRAPVTQ